MTVTDREALLSAWVKPSSDTEQDQQDRGLAIGAARL
jgi:hypothetical protein